MDDDTVPTLGRRERRKARLVRTNRFTQDIAKMRAFGPRGKTRRAGRRRT